MKWIVIFAVATLALLLPPVARAQSLTLDEVLRSADARFPAVTSAERERDLAAADATAARGAFDPTWRTSASATVAGTYPGQRVDTLVTQPTPLWGASVFAGYRLGVGKYPGYDGKLETNDYGELRGGVSVPILRDGPIDRGRAGIRRADLGVEAAGAGVAQTRLEVRRVSELRYWDWVAAGRRLAIARSLLSLAASRDAQLAARAERGEIPTFERTENSRAILQRQAGVVAAERGLQQAAIELSLFLRTEQGTPRVPTESELPKGLPDPRAADLSQGEGEARALAQRPDLRRIEAQRAQLDVERTLAENQTRPAVNVFVSASRDLGPGDVSRAGTVVEAGITVDVPLLNRTANGRLAAAEAGLGRVEAQRRLARDRAVAEVRDARSAMDAARERAAVLGREVDLARALAEGEMKRFDAGEGTLLLVNLREQATAEAEQRALDARVEWLKANASWRAATASR